MPSTPAVSIRPAEVDQIPDIQRIGCEADARYTEVGHPELADGSTIPTDAAERAIAKGQLLVAHLGDVLVGWVYLGRIAGELCVGQISVATSAGRQGIGSALLRRVIEDARTAGEASIVLNTQSDVGWGQPWYQRHGFRVVARSECTPALMSIVESQTRDGLDWSTRVHMRLRLETAAPSTLAR